MKSKILFFMMVVLTGVFISCSDDDEVKLKGDPDVVHEGDKWTITSMEYTLIDQGLSGSSVNQTFKEGTKANAGSFYFVNGGVKGSFEINVEGYNKEDLFEYDDTDGSVNISQMTQTVGVTTNQNVVEIGGSSTATEMTLSGVISKQSMAGQFVLTVHSMVLTKN